MSPSHERVCVMSMIERPIVQDYRILIESTRSSSESVGASRPEDVDDDATINARRSIDSPDHRGLDRARLRK